MSDEVLSKYTLDEAHPGQTLIVIGSTNQAEIAAKVTENLGAQGYAGNDFVEKSLLITNKPNLISWPR